MISTFSFWFLPFHSDSYVFIVIFTFSFRFSISNFIFFLIGRLGENNSSSLIKKVRLVEFKLFGREVGREELKLHSEHILWFGRSLQGQCPNEEFSSVGVEGRPKDAFRLGLAKKTTQTAYCLVFSLACAVLSPRTINQTIVKSGPTRPTSPSSLLIFLFFLTEWYFICWLSSAVKEEAKIYCKHVD